MNANDARISKIAVAKKNADIQEAAPNAPDSGTGTPDTSFDVVVEMEAGSSVAGGYKLLVTCHDDTEGTHVSALDPPTPLNGPGNFAVTPWVTSPAGTDRVFDVTKNVPVPTGVSEHVFHYTAALMADNYQIIDIQHSEPFILV